MKVLKKMVETVGRVLNTVIGGDFTRPVDDILKRYPRLPAYGWI